MRHQYGHTQHEILQQVLCSPKVPSRHDQRLQSSGSTMRFFFPEAGGFRETRTKLLTRCELEVQFFFFFVATAAVCPYRCGKQHTAKRKLNRFSATGREERSYLKAYTSKQCSMPSNGYHFQKGFGRSICSNTHRS